MAPFNPSEVNPQLAVFSMECYLESYLNTYGGGLGVLTGDYARAMADLHVPAVVVTQSSNSGYFRQRIDENGWQQDDPIEWDPKTTLNRIEQTVKIPFKGRSIEVAAEVYCVKSEPRRGKRQHIVPVYLVDTDVEGNVPEDKTITSTLYPGSDEKEHMLSQEYVLGSGGMKLLRAFGYDNIRRFHFNEGHAFFAALELLAEGKSIDEVKAITGFTTHTPKQEAHERWKYDLVDYVTSGAVPSNTRDLAGHDELNTTRLLLNTSGDVNAVSRKHWEVCKAMEVFNGYDITYRTNGVHPATWAGRSMRKLFDTVDVGGPARAWRWNPDILRKVIGKLTPEQIAEAREDGKRHLISYLNSEHGFRFRQGVLTFAWARRMHPYKRADLFLNDHDRLYKIAEKWGPLQFLFAGKAHPKDDDGKRLLQKIVHFSRIHTGPLVSIGHLSGYNTKLAKRIHPGIDVWCNTPRRPEEASGTSGMKSALNGGLRLSTFDGWEVEAYEMNQESVFIIGPRRNQLTVNLEDDREDAESALDQIEHLAEIYYRYPKENARLSKESMSVAHHFTAHRAIREYIEAWGMSLEDFQ